MIFGSGARRRQKAGRGSWDGHEPANHRLLGDRPLGADVLRLAEMLHLVVLLGRRVHVVAAEGGLLRGLPG